MASQPRRRLLTAALADRARKEISVAATPLDYVCAWVAGGASIARLARSLQHELRMPVSRPWMAFCAHRLGRDATQRIQAARASRGTAYARAYPKVRSFDVALGKDPPPESRPPPTRQVNAALHNRGQGEPLRPRVANSLTPQTIREHIAEPPIT
jgi:hypothetical protein